MSRRSLEGLTWWGPPFLDAMKLRCSIPPSREKRLGSVKSDDTLSQVIDEHNTQIRGHFITDDTSICDEPRRDACARARLTLPKRNGKRETPERRREPANGRWTTRLTRLNSRSRLTDRPHTRVGRCRRRRRPRKPTEARAPLQTSNFDRRVLATRG